MKIDRNLVSMALQNHLAQEDRAGQPELSFGCFLSLRKEGQAVTTTEVYCEKCPHFQKTCRAYLEDLRIQEPIFIKYC